MSTFEMYVGENGETVAVGPDGGTYTWDAASSSWAPLQEPAHHHQQLQQQQQRGRVAGTGVGGVPSGSPVRASSSSGSRSGLPRHRLDYDDDEDVHLRGALQGTARSLQNGLDENELRGMQAHVAALNERLKQEEATRARHVRAVLREAEDHLRGNLLLLSFSFF